MTLLIMLCGTLWMQSLTEPANRSWENMARPWMTRAEQDLYDRLDQREKIRFQGYFVARRAEKPDDWLATGLYLPSFFAPEPHGDVRDQIAYHLGYPKEIEWQPTNPRLPRVWKYPQYSFYFLPAGSGNVRLTGESDELWDNLKGAMVKQPALRYDFRDNSFGRTRLPEDLAFIDSEVLQSWSQPNPSGNTYNFTIKVPAEMKAYAREGTHLGRRHLEMLVYLKNDPEQPREALDAELIRHAATWSRLTEDDELHFEVNLPPGYYHAEMLVYNGFMAKGIRAEYALASLPREAKRIGTPIMSQQWRPAGIEAAEAGIIDCGGDRYQPARAYDPARAGRVLVQQLGETRPQVLLENQQGAGQALQFLFSADGWAVFDLPAQSDPAFRLIALGPENNGTMPFSVGGTNFAAADAASKPAFKQAGQDYLQLERLEFNAPGNLQFLFVNDTPYLASRNGSFTWSPLDWGRNARLRLAFEENGRRRSAAYELKRAGIFTQVRVGQKSLVVGTRVPDGKIEGVDIEVFVEGAKIPPTKATPFTSLPKMWGIVVNDPLLKSPAWNSIRQALLVWLQKNTQATDMIYVVQISHRPELLVAPTTRKSLIQACLLALEPSSPRANFFTVRYLMDALTHMKQHGSLPHQALILTHQLTDEVSQLEDLLPLLRKTGLQVYNLEFPFEFVPESTLPTKPDPGDSLAQMKVREEADQRERLAIRDNFQEDRNVTAGFRVPLGARKAKRMAEEERIKIEAFRASFSKQLASMTAGLAHVSGSGETSQSLHRFLDQITQWQRSLVHLELPLPYVAEDMIRVQAAAGYAAAWTLVEWTPETAPTP
ncbi:hypothetical protein [Acanthopleuribacter pedis]|uniref:Uncharacterized protein n=1 Tax=Acanthopleuribacter pedis TaxID=442870 RepID=A0A8J7U6R8_9BACT|nr:hypothetical protein [Acanthopleuribacter pedis]MBO1322214.1 hypothetical protein [Acanthopleuribacter pedis]